MRTVRPLVAAGLNSRLWWRELGGVDGGSWQRREGVMAARGNRC